MFWLDFVKCKGDEESLFECAHLGLGEDRCGDDGRRVGVECKVC